MLALRQGERAWLRGPARVPAADAAGADGGLTREGARRIARPFGGAAGWPGRVLFEIVEVEEGMRGRRLGPSGFAHQANVLAALGLICREADWG